MKGWFASFSTHVLSNTINHYSVYMLKYPKLFFYEDKNEDYFHVFSFKIVKLPLFKSNH